MVEGEGLARAVALEHQLGKLFVLLHHHGKILGHKLRGVTRGADDGLHAQLGKAQVKHGLNVLEEIRVGVRKGASHVVALAASGLNQLLEFGHDAIPASLACVVYAEAVVDLAAAVKAQDHVVALAVGKVDDVIVDEHSVGGQGKAEVLVVLFFHRARVGDQLLDDVKIHQRLAAEEVDLQIAARARIGDEEVQGLLAHLKAHHGSVAVVLSLAGKAVGAVEVAGVRHVQAEGLDHARALFLQLARHALKGVGSKELARLLKREDLVVALGNILGGDVLAALVFFLQEGEDLLARMVLKESDGVVGQLVHHVDAARAGIQNDIIAAKPILMYHR